MPEDYLTIYPRKHFGFGIVASTMFRKYRSRSILGLSLMISQAFLYNAIFFTYALVLTRFYHVPAPDTGNVPPPLCDRQFSGAARLGPLF